MRFCNLKPVSDCIQMIGEVLTATFVVYDKIETISVDETSDLGILQIQENFHNKLACVFTGHYASKNAD